MILVFKTSVKRRSQIAVLKNSLDSITSNGKWNFDLFDQDKILRIETEKNIVPNITSLLQEKGFTCSELEDK